jgi:peptidoglycan/xylan/chitin deacetylase (PgdA/CDA1 family)/3D (Asp-Asp-Asp) domain-containing protein
MAITVAMMTLFVRPLGWATFDSNALTNYNLANCSTDWYITGYFTPVERDYASIQNKIIYVQGIGNIAFNSQFLTDVALEGWGKTKLGWYIGYHDNGWYKSSSALSVNRQPLTIGMVATDQRLIPPDASLTIGTLPRPWNLITYIATDAGPAITGKHIDVYTGEGKIAQTKMSEITGHGNIVCLSHKINFFKTNAHRIPCNCVIFRMDDVQDYWMNQGQLIPMDLFMSKNQSLTLGLIMHLVGNESDLINKVREGYSKGLFELALHGWNHVDYSKLSEQQQEYSLEKANEKMKYLFGTTSKIFIAPYDAFNNDTLKAISHLGIRTISSMEYMEDNFNHNSSIFAANGETYNNTGNQTIFHIPGTITFKQYLHGIWVKTPIWNILNALSYDIEHHGYAVVVLHPQDFVKSDNNGTLTNTLDQSEIYDLEFLVDLILSKNIHIVSFSKLVREAT